MFNEILKYEMVEIYLDIDSRKENTKRKERQNGTINHSQKRHLHLKIDTQTDRLHNIYTFRSKFLTK